MILSPNLSAIMCDGMGWFSDNDYKRMLLTYDEIYYLLPRNLVQFQDVSGKKQSLFFPIVFRENPSFKVQYFTPDAKSHQLIVAAARADLANPKFVEVVDTIPSHEQLYTWRVVNADGDIGSGQSIGLSPGQEQLAHAILLNKFLLAANALKSIPITGKSYIHGLISEKYSLSIEHLRDKIPDVLPPLLRTGAVKHNPVVSRIISTLVPDEELETHSEADIMRFKEENKVLFQRYSYAVRELVNRVSAFPMTDDFDSEVDELIRTEIWKEKTEIEKELRSAWEGLFKSAIKSALAGLVGVGIAPFLSLGAITLASVVAASIAISPWVTSELIDFIETRKKTHEHGLYYLMKFGK
ncbi:MAG TPA: hypothetical protein VIH18_22165 [Candidatus Binatia bacterium]|jgi:hypothetical protein